MKTTYVILSLCAIAQAAHAIKPDRQNHRLEVLISTSMSANQTQPSLHPRGIDEKIERASDLIIAALKKLCCCKQKN